MDFDFSLILVVLTLVSGLIWLGFWLFVKVRTRGGSNAMIKEPVVVEYSRSFFPVLFLVLVVRSFLIEPFQIPSQSMMPTLEVGDFILVNKYSYGLRVPVLGYKFLDLGDPQRGDVMVFRTPEDNTTNYIKRVVGVPGDTVEYKDKRLTINGQPIDEKLIAALPAGAPRELYYEEQLGEKLHRIIKENYPNTGHEGKWVVPEGKYFMMGDNRDRSKDSRYIGLVPDENIVGRAFAIWMHWEKFLSLPSFSRVGSIQ
ncbi:signal peptidase I [Hahella aquimaris]|uniref:signal peptidase I n=1 Tax=Hahella sp. HNIBRBA332 TaxID=3015983 RepID=UPI00273A93D6|nr:signal peptidase I [Hahella sp. HNIBRBA332]WLQ11514.1 signal peptidase I [Hahella sp. HNIBRBA332]